MGLMSHPEVEGLGEYVDERQFKQVWEPRGWVQVQPAVAAVAELLPTPVADLDELKKEELLEVAAQVGAEAKTSDTKAEIIEKIEAAPSVAAETAAASGEED